jgi:hypothetical protein
VRVGSRVPQCALRQNGRSVHWAHVRSIFRRQVEPDRCLPVVRSTRNFLRMCASPVPRVLPSLVSVGPWVPTLLCFAQNGTTDYTGRTGRATILNALRSRDVSALGAAAGSVHLNHCMAFQTAGLTGRVPSRRPNVVVLCAKRHDRLYRTNHSERPQIPRCQRARIFADFDELLTIQYHNHCLSNSANYSDCIFYYYCERQKICPTQSG